MNENTTNNTTTLNQDSTPEEHAKNPRGRHATSTTVTDKDDDGYALTATITLDNSTTLELTGSRECSRGNRATYVKHALQRGGRNARTMNARVETTHDDEHYYETDHTTFVMNNGNPTQLPLATPQEYDENSYYGTGSTPTARRGANNNTTTT